MPWHLLSYFLGGAVLANAIPHLVSGMQGRPFQSPFAKPPGQGLSSATVNAFWGFLNLAAGYFLICHVGNFDLRDWSDVSAFGAGVLVMAVFAARHFGRSHGGDLSGRSHPTDIE
jgi:hypothetical protein